MTAQETNVVNAVSTTLNATMAAGATSFTVVSATGFPTVPFYVVIDPDVPAKREYMLVDSSLVGTTCSMTSTAKRNLSGSAGDVEHLSGVPVRVSPVLAQLFEDLHDRIDGKQPLDADLTAIAALSSASNKVPYATGAGTWGLLDFKDEDDMASDSATAVPSQQSVKAYVDSLSGSVVAEGTYVGNAGIDRTIPLAFTPKFVFLVNETSGTAVFFGAIGTSGTYGFAYTGSASVSNANGTRPKPTTNGFIVSDPGGASTNQSANTYRYVVIG